MSIASRQHKRFDNNMQYWIAHAHLPANEPPPFPNQCQWYIRWKILYCQPAHRIIISLVSVVDSNANLFFPLFSPYIVIYIMRPQFVDGRKLLFHYFDVCHNFIAHGIVVYFAEIRISAKSIKKREMCTRETENCTSHIDNYPSDENCRD